MVTSNKKAARSKANAAFTLVEVVMAIGILVLAMSGMIYGYVQTNYQAEWSSMSLAVQALTVQSVEQARAAKWDVYSSASGSNPDELPPSTNTIIYTNSVLIPSSGQTMSVTITLKIRTITTIPALREIRSDCGWYFSRSGKWYTNTVVTYRGAN
jgi:type II secretory pathway pseudopilin PulG